MQRIREHQAMKINGAVAAAILAAGLSPALSSAQSTSDWKYEATIYGYFPSIGGSTTFPPPAGGSSATVDIDTIIDALKFAFMGSFEANNGRWGVFADVIYLDIGGNKDQTQDFSLGSVGLPAGVSADVGVDLKGWVSTVVGTYRTPADPVFTVDVVGGARVLNMRPKVDWALTGNVGSIALPDRAGSRELSEQNWDLVFGVKGRAKLGQGGAWFAPYYLDLGTGESKFTWQAIGGVGYTFGWGDVVATYRYTEYQMKSDQALQDLTFSGPTIGATFRW
jgi:hypothetical protein